MTYHVLTGDALLQNFPKGKLEGSVVIIRECLIEGPVKVDSLAAFWEERKAYLSEAYPESDIHYVDDVVFEFEKLMQLQDGDEVNFWFEHDLFCQLNFWFTLAILPDKNLNLYRISPLVKNPKMLWHGFGPMSRHELLNCYSNKIQMTSSDLALGKNLWNAYANSNMSLLSKLSNVTSPSFPHLKEVCKAQIDRLPDGRQNGRPERVLKQIVDSGINNFEDAFQIFSEQEGIYGFGDSQILKIYDQLTA